MISLKSYAKVNLGLRIVGRRPDGYHEISSYMALVSLYDEIIIEESSKLEIICSGFPELEDPAINIAAKALRQFMPTFKMTIKKRIPLGAGLGGGSSNAGSILKHFGSTDGISLGSDVPFFLNGPFALVEGIGEKVKSVNPESLPRRNFLILTPDIHCDTKTVYEHFDGRLSEPFTESCSGLLGNDLTRAACTAYPVLKDLLGEVLSIEPDSQLSGSGSSIISFPKDHKIESFLLNLGIPYFKVSFLTSLP